MLHNPAVALGPGEWTFFLGLAGSEVVYARPRRSLRRKRAVVVAAAVIHIPIENSGIHALAAQPFAEWNLVEVGMRWREAAFHGNREPAARAEFADLVFEAAKLVAIVVSEADRGFDSILPAAVKKQALLRGETEEAVVPDTVFQHAQVFEKLTNINRAWARDRNVVRGPGVVGDFVFAPARVTARLLIHFEQDEIAEAPFLQSPGGAQAGYAAAHDDQRVFLNFPGNRKYHAVAQLMAHLEGIIHEAAGDRAIGFQRKADERSSAGLQKLPARDSQ